MWPRVAESITRVTLDHAATSHLKLRAAILADRLHAPGLGGLSVRFALQHVEAQTRQAVAIGQLVSNEGAASSTRLRPHDAVGVAGGAAVLRSIVIGLLHRLLRGAPNAMMLRSPGQAFTTLETKRPVSLSLARPPVQ